jgi:hypothetical protein
MPDHSPTPWRIHPHTGHVEDARGELVCCPVDDQGRTHIDFPLIVRAVNLHDESYAQLVMMSVDIVELFESFRDGIFKRLGVKWEDEPPAIKAARAILAKAKGEQ